MKLAVLDFETDPFEHGKEVQPFLAGFYDGSTYTSFWGSDCVPKLIRMIRGLQDPHVIYAHNGGRFDFFFIMQYLDYDLRIVNSRIIQAHIGIHELRDSFAIMPFALEKYSKTPIDYDKFKKHRREKYRDEITKYCGDDCKDLWTLCNTFRADFGDVLTIGSAAMRQLKTFHKFSCGNDVFDARFRQDFYFGGRNQVFQSGVINGPIRCYDINSQYPYVMRDYLHPVSTGVYHGTRVDDRTAFLTVEGQNLGALPSRTKAGGLDFTVPRGTFHTTIHEFNAALETGTFKPDRIIKTYGFSERITFAEFITHFYDARCKARESGDKIHTLFFKYVMNSSYGKFAQNPLNYFDYFICPMGELPKEWHDCSKSCEESCRLKWSLAFQTQNDYMIWQRPLKSLSYYNIATGASITGAARSILLRGLSKAIDPMYCDTDSIICRGLRDVPISDTELGAWKLEAEAVQVAIGGKKLYAMFDAQGACIKKAHKGARLTGEDILSIARGRTVESCSPVPTFKMDPKLRCVTQTFTKRSIKATGSKTLGKIGA
jgi:DNA polymerase elongation subunit (family B)